VINAGVGDSDLLINEWKAGVLIEDFGEDDYLKAAREIEIIIGDGEVREKAREVAEKVFNLETIAGERYASLYERVLNAD
jgi:hypothetical protein